MMTGRGYGPVVIVCRTFESFSLGSCASKPSDRDPNTVVVRKSRREKVIASSRMSAMKTANSIARGDSQLDCLSDLPFNGSPDCVRAWRASEAVPALHVGSAKFRRRYDEEFERSFWVGLIV